METNRDSLNRALTEALGQIAREKSVDQQVLIETLEAGLLSAAKKKLGSSADVTIDFDPESGAIDMYAIMEVADDFDAVDRGYQMPLIEAKRLKADARVGDRIKIQLPIAEFGRNAIQAAKQVLIQRVREAERDRVYDEYHDRVGELVTGIVQQIDRGNFIVQLDRAEAILPAREQIGRDRFRQGEHVRALIAAVDRNAKGPQIVLTRTSIEFLIALFQSEVPEIGDGVVEIRAVAREPGARSKVAVVSQDEKVDAVGACVGIKGSRVQSIVREMNGERIDIVPWSSDAVLYVSRALSPARVKSVTVSDDGTTMHVVVEDDQLSLAIGKGGQNARLAAKLTGFKIDLISEGEVERQNEFETLMRIDVEQLPGVGPKLSESLIRAGIETVGELAAAELTALLEIPGIAQRTAEKLQSIAQRLLVARRQEVDRVMAEREAEAQAAAEQEEAEAEAAEQEEAEAEAAEMAEGVEVTDDGAEDADAAAEVSSETDAASDSAGDHSAGSASNGDAPPDHRITGATATGEGDSETAVVDDEIPTREDA